MKKLLTASLPVLALFALGGCTTTRSVATTEDDGVYYSSKDRNTAVARTAPAPRPEAISSVADTGEATNPDYQAPASTGQQASNAPEYYDDNYTSSSYSSYDNSRFRRPYTGPTVGLAYYAPPVVFAPAYSYGWGAGDCGFSPYGSPYCDPFYSAYSPVYYQPYGFRPYGYGYGGPFVSIAFGFGRPWGGYGYGYGRPYYGGYGYDRYYGYSGYNRGYGYGNGGYYGGRQIIRANGSSAPANNPVLVGRRTGRGGDVLAGRGNAPTAPTTTPTPTPTGGRRRIVATDPTTTTPSSGLIAPTNPGTTTAPNSYGRRERNGSVAPNSPTAINDPNNQPTGRRYRDVSGSQTDVASPASVDPGRAPRGRWRNQEDGGAVSGTTTGTTPDAGRRYEQPQQTDVQPIERTNRRPRLAAPTTTGAEQSQPVYRANRQEQPVQPQQSQPQPQRVYERPQRSYEQPAATSQPQRSYERPASSQPSYSAPSGGGGSNGGSGGGGGGGRRGRF